MSRLYVVLDVFTDTSLTGNPLAVVLDSAGLDDAAMQRIARQFNLSETIFLLPAEDESRKARLRIFMPHKELPFAGHPTVGAAVLLGLMDAAAGKGAAATFELEERVGPIACEARATGRRSGYGRFVIPRLPSPTGTAPSPAGLAGALGLEPDDLGDEGHPVSRFEAGNTFCFAPIRSLEALGRARIDPTLWRAVFGEDIGCFLYTRETGDPSLAFRARMLEPGIGEDPATGSAAAAFAGVLAAFDRPADGTHTFRIGQGYEMGRPSVIELGMTIERGALVSATIGGTAVVTAEGTLFVR
ncbi:PhzF family phenazine biosynthesis protein [Chelatococcus sambhunathii]|uniref:PhzF family phenazine biosynthesis protein n=1 Tax=Chelatococcus sambhunathii TaxID=363953 RepID=A0ABU1DEZ3_9HYPH|nr:PhzF family phenazine biosynthesis protein [Chelatococcus sambhunathii]MDR4306669.1 PhzF family phenazine biosynthesis protein [Chelatococcus sambhunathii]